MSALSFALVLQLAANPACTVPGMVADFWPNVIKAESHYDPFAIGDDTAARSYYPATADAAEALALKLMAQGHSVGVGLSQLTAKSPEEFYATFGMTVREALNACANMKAGARHYVIRSLAIYNAGSPISAKGLAYAERVTASIRTGSMTAVPMSVSIRVNRHASDTEAW